MVQVNQETEQTQTSSPARATIVTNLTIPIYSYLPLGSVWPWESAFWTEDIATIERNEARLFFISMGSETGTRLMGPGLAADTAPKIQDLPLDVLVNRPTSVLRVPKGEGEAITPGDVQTAFREATDLQQGDAVLLATGWGDEARWKKLGERYSLESPYLTEQAAQTLVSLMKDNKSQLLLTDCAHLDRAGDSHARGEWLGAPSWQRPTWPSEQAKAYLRHYTAEMAREDWASTLTVVRNLWTVAGLANCGQIGARRVHITVLPMFVQGAGEAPCTVVAEVLDEEGKSNKARD